MSESAMEPQAKISEKARAPLPDNAALRRFAAGVEAEIGERFFASLARGLSLALEVQYAFVTRLSDDGTHFKTLGLWERDHLGKNVEKPLTGTPCELVLRGQAAHHPTELRARFPDDQLLAEWRAQSYCGVQVLDAQGRVFGHVAIVDDKPMPADPLVLSVLETFANRAGVELERERAFQSLFHQNQENEERFRVGMVVFRRHSGPMGGDRVSGINQRSAGFRLASCFSLRLPVACLRNG